MPQTPRRDIEKWRSSYVNWYLAGPASISISPEPLCNFLLPRPRCFHPGALVFLVCSLPFAIKTHNFCSLFPPLPPPERTAVPPGGNERNRNRIWGSSLKLQAKKCFIFILHQSVRNFFLFNHLVRKYWKHFSNFKIAFLSNQRRKTKDFQFIFFLLVVTKQHILWALFCYLSVFIFIH